MTGFLDEMRSAWRGFLKLVTGDRTAASHFDFSPHGLAGAAIAYLAVTALIAYLPMLLGLGGGRVTLSIVFSLISTSLQFLFTAIVLRQLGRTDGFVPYLVAYGWSTAFLNVIVAALTMLGLGGSLLLIMTGLAVLWMEINIARLIVTLSGLQIAMLIVAQLVAASIGFLLLSLFLPVPPELAGAAVQ
jgi:hypothetical protein